MTVFIRITILLEDRRGRLNPNLGRKHKQTISSPIGRLGGNNFTSPAAGAEPERSDLLVCLFVVVD